MSTPSKAGAGEPHKFIIHSDKEPSNTPYQQEEKQYIGIDAVVWFVNDQSNFFFDRMVAGTIEIKINGKNYQVVIGSYELKGGERVAPIFDRPLITSIPYISGDIGIKVVIQGNRKDTLAGTLLKQVASATLTAVAGTVSLEATAGIGAVALTAAGGTLVEGVQKFLSNNDDKKVPIFDPYEVWIDPLNDLKGAENYLLIHRGNDDLENNLFTIVSGVQGTDVLYNSQHFRDGAWLLLRFHQNFTYVGDPRPWRKDVLDIKNEFDEMISSWKNEIHTIDEVKKNLVKGSNEEKYTIVDRLIVVQRKIKEDEALISQDRKKYSGVLNAYLQAAKNAITANDPNVYFNAIDTIEKTLKECAPQPKILTDALIAEFNKDQKTPNKKIEMEDIKKLTFNEKILQ